MSEFGTRLREIRTRMGLDQAAFGSLGGVNRNTQSKYESGERAPDTVYLELIRDAGADVAYMLTGMPGAALPASIASLVNLASRLTDQQRDAVTSLINAFIAPDRATDPTMDESSPR